VSKVAPFRGLGEKHKRESPLRMRERWGLIGRISTRFNIVRSHVEGQFWYWIYSYIAMPLPIKMMTPSRLPGGDVRREPLLCLCS